jgi:hypothetical protein
MSRKKAKRYRRKARRSTPTQKNIEKKRWVLTIDSKEAAVNFYSILAAFQRSGGGGLINEEALEYIAKWMNVILEYDPDIEKLADDSRGPFRERDTSPLTISLELNSKERSLMLFIWKTMYSQLITPKMRDHWIKNQGREDYELAMKNYKSWIDSLEGEGFIPGITPKGNEPSK